MDSCGCINIDVDECATVLLDMMRTARKAHVCQECKRTIPPGESYHFETMKFDGKIESYKTCADCYSIREVFFCNGFYYGMIIENLNEHIADLEGRISSDCILKLTPGARDMVFEIIEEVWAELNEDEEEERAEHLQTTAIRPKTADS